MKKENSVGFYHISKRSDEPPVTEDLVSKKKYQTPTFKLWILEYFFARVIVYSKLKSMVHSLFKKIALPNPAINCSRRLPNLILLLLRFFFLLFRYFDCICWHRIQHDSKKVSCCSTQYLPLTKDMTNLSKTQFLFNYTKFQHTPELKNKSYFC